MKTDTRGQREFESQLERMEERVRNVKDLGRFITSRDRLYTVSELGCPFSLSGCDASTCESLLRSASALQREASDLAERLEFSADGDLTRRARKCERDLDKKRDLLSRAEEYFRVIQAAHAQLDKIEQQVNTSYILFHYRIPYSPRFDSKSFPFQAKKKY